MLDKDSVESSTASCSFGEEKQSRKAIRLSRARNVVNKEKLVPIKMIILVPIKTSIVQQVAAKVVTNDEFRAQSTSGKTALGVHFVRSTINSGK